MRPTSSHTHTRRNPCLGSDLLLKLLRCTAGESQTPNAWDLWASGFALTGLLCFGLVGFRLARRFEFRGPGIESSELGFELDCRTVRFSARVLTIHTVPNHKTLDLSHVSLKLGNLGLECSGCGMLCCSPSAARVWASTLGAT